MFLVSTKREWAMAMRVAQEQHLPKYIASLDVIASDYADLFVASTDLATSASAEQWARLAIEEAPAVGRLLAWRLACALRLESEPSADHVGGWQITGRDERWVRLEARSWFMTANMIFAVEPGRVCFATLVHYDHPAGRMIWGRGVSAIHRRVAPGFLGGAVARMRTRRSGS